MSKKSVEVKKKLELGASGVLKLSVKIGDGQPGLYHVIFKNQFLPIQDIIEIGSFDVVRGKSIFIVATITDEREETNWTSVRIEFFNNSQSIHLKDYKEQVDEDFGKVIYTIEYELI